MTYTLDTTYTTKNEINICERIAGREALRITDTKNMTTWLATDEDGLLATVVKFSGKYYPIQGNCFFGYIVIE